MNEICDMTEVSTSDLRPLIHEIRGVQVMLAHDLADIYHVTTRVFNQAVKRNQNRFPANFRFQLTREELEEVITNCDNPDRLRYSPTLPFAFTEQGVAMLSGVLRSDVAVQTSIRLMETFVSMRRALQSMHPLLARIQETERRQIVDQARNEERFEKIFDAMQDKRFPPQKLFFDGEFYDAFLWIKDMINKARTELIVIDPYFDISVLPLFVDKHPNVKLYVVHGPRGKKLPEFDIAKFNAQYANTLRVKESDLFHDRFLIIDRKLLVHIGASLNYLGKKCFAASTFDPRSIPEMLLKID